MVFYQERGNAKEAADTAIAIVRLPCGVDCAIVAALYMRIMRTCACTGCVAGAVGGAGARAGAVVGARAFAVAVAGLRARVRLLAPAVTASVDPNSKFLFMIPFPFPSMKYDHDKCFGSPFIHAIKSHAHVYVS